MSGGLLHLNEFMLAFLARVVYLWEMLMTDFSTWNYVVVWTNYVFFREIHSVKLILLTCTGEMFSTTESMNLFPLIRFGNRIQLRFVFKAYLGRAGIASRRYDTRCRMITAFKSWLLLSRSWFGNEIKVYSQTLLRNEKFSTADYRAL